MPKKANPNDPRSIRTRQALHRALIDLIPEVGFDGLTVLALTERAGLNRATFYQHYDDKYDLLLTSMDEVYEELIEVTSPPGVLQAGAFIPEEEPRIILQALEHVTEHAAFYRVMLGEEGVPAFTGRVRAVMEQIVDKWLTFFGVEDDGYNRQILRRYIVSGHMGLMQWWIENDMPVPPEELAQQMHTMTIGLFGALGIVPPFPE